MAYKELKTFPETITPIPHRREETKSAFWQVLIRLQNVPCATLAAQYCNAINCIRDTARNATFLPSYIGHFGNACPGGKSHQACLYASWEYSAYYDDGS